MRKVINRKRTISNEEKAMKAVRKAICSGDLIKPNRCSKCKAIKTNPRNIHAHHNDYSKQLEVVWLCNKCHLNIHRSSVGKNKNGKNVNVKMTYEQHKTKNQIPFVTWEEILTIGLCVAKELYLKKDTELA